MKTCTLNGEQSWLPSLRNISVKLARKRAHLVIFIAGDDALSAYANQEAEILYRSALDLSCCTDTENAWLYSGLGQALYRQSRLEEALQMFWKASKSIN